MAKAVQLPDGSWFPLIEGESPDAALAEARKKYPDAFGAPLEKPAAAPKTGIGADIASSFSNLLNIGRTGLGAITGDATQAAQAGLAREQETAAKYKPTFDTEKITKPFEEGKYGEAALEAVKGVPGAAAQLAPSIGQELGLAAIGRIGGGALGSALGSLAGPPGAVAGAAVGSQVGQYALPFVVNAIQALGSQAQSKVQAQVEAGEKPDVSALQLAPYAAANAAANLIGTKVAMPSIFKDVIGKKVAAEAEDAARAKILAEAEKVAGRGAAKTIGYGVGKFAFGELPTEVLQDVIDRAATGQSLTDDDAFKQYRTTALTMALASPLGGGFGLQERAGARQQVEQAKKEDAAKSALMAEAQKNTPEALNELYENFKQLTQRRDELAAKVNELKPKKSATPEEKTAYEQAKAERNTFMKDEYAPVAQEYNKRKDAIDTMFASQQARMETEAAAGQPTAAKALPSDIPGAQPFQLSPVAKLMDEHDRLRNQHDEITTKLAEGPDLDTHAALDQQRVQLEARMAELAPAIEQRGGVTDTQAEFEKKIKAAEAERVKLLSQGDWPAANKQAEKIRAMQARLPIFEELRLSREQAGQTRELFGGPTPTKTAEQLEQERQTRAEEKATADYMQGKKPEPVETKAPQVIQPQQLEAVEKAKEQANTAQQDLAGVAKSKDTDAIYAALDKANQAENAVARAREDVGRPTLKPAVVDIFDPSNIIRTAIDNGDTKLLSDMAAHADRNALQQALDKSTDERTKLINVLESRLDLGGAERATTEKGPKTGEQLRSVKRERADLFSQLYDVKQQAQFKNGTSLEVVERERTDENGKPVIGKNGLPVIDKVKLQDIYDKGGPAAVEHEWVLDRIRPLMKKVTTPQGNAKQSLYEKLINIAAQHAEAVAQMESGVATPTMREKAATLQAKLGKGEAPAQRPMNAGEKYQLQRRIASLEKEYGKIEKQITPIRDEILKTYGSLYKTTPLEKPSVVKAREREKATAEARLPKAKTRTASTAARLERGDVRREAETSQKLRDLAKELGQREPEFEKFSAGLTRRLEALKNRYGPNDNAVIVFRNDMARELANKAEELGRKTPEYKATLKEQVQYFREVLPTAGKQEVPTKRTGAVTRRQFAAPSRLVTSSPESRAASEAEALREKRRLFKDFEEGIASEKTAYRFGEEKAAQVVDAAEAQKVVDGLKLPENVKFVYAATPGELPIRVLRQMQKDGVDPTTDMVKGAVLPDGTVVVVGNQHADVKDLEETIAHELIGHYGVDTVIGLNRLQEFANNTDVLKLAEQVGGSKLQAEVKATMDAMRDQSQSEAVQKLQGIRELIAHTEEVRMTEAFRDRAKRWLKELVGMVREGLRKMGLANYAEATPSDVFYMLRASRRAFASRQIGPYRGADGQTAFRRRREPSDSVVATEPTFADKFLGNVMGLAGRVQFVDQYAALDAAIKKGLNEGQINALEAVNAQYLLRFSQQRSQYAGQFLTNGPLKLELTKKNGVTTSLFRSTKGVNMVDVANALNQAKLASPTEQENMFTVYLAGERARQVGWEKLNFFDPTKAKAEYDGIMDKLNANKQAADAFKKAKELYQEYNAGLLDFLVQTGVMTPAKAAELKAITYVPYYRVNKNGEVQLMIDKEHPVRISNIKDEPQLQALVGGNEQIMPVFTSSVQNTFMITNMGLRNQAVKETSFLLQKLGMASRVTEGNGPANNSVVRFKKNGKDYYASIDTDLYGIPADLVVKGMEGIKTTMPAVVRLMGMPANVLRKFVTRMPSYAIRQVIRDPLNAWLTTGTDATPVLSSMKELATMVAGRSEAERKLMETGAISSNVFSGDEQDMAKFLKDISAGKSMWAKTLAKADAFAMQGDAATRAVIYKDSLNKGMSEQEALLRTLESMNFSRRGVSPSMQMLSVLIPFFNAQVQGLDVIWRAYKGQMPFSEQLKIKEKMMARGLMLAMGTLAYAALMSDDEAYKRAKPEERFGNWFVYLPGVSEPVRVPMPFELGFVFKALPEAVYGMAFNDERGGKTLKGLGKLADQSNPFSLPQAIKPITEVVLGKSFFGGDIESAREKEQLATERYRANSTEISKLLGQVTGMVGISPIQIDYLIRGYFGGLGVALVSMADPILAPDQKDVAKPSTKPSKLPLIGGLFQPVEGRGTLDEAYDRMTEIRQVKGTYNRLKEEGKMAEAKAFVQNYSNDLAQASISGGVQKKLGELAKQERIVREHPKMSQNEKDARLKAIDERKMQIARQFLARQR
jgi:Large polyvalent protein associated domain 38